MKNSHLIFCTRYSFETQCVSDFRRIFKNDVSSSTGCINRFFSVYIALGFSFNSKVIMFQALIFFLTGFFPAIVSGQVPFPPLSQPVTVFSFEDKNWNVEALTTPKSGQLGTPTPISIPGARVIRTLELKALLDTNKNVVVVDVLGSKTRKSIPGAFWLSGAGDGQFYAAEKSRFAIALEKLTGGDKTRPLVFLCTSSECWLSYNASLYALEAGYKDIIWYRGGTSSWTGASLEWTQPESVRW